MKRQAHSPISLVGFVLIGFVLIGLVLVGHTLHIDYRNRLQLEWANAGHVPVFALLFVAIWWLWPIARETWIRSAGALAVTALVAVAGEFVQLFGSRNADPVDVARDLCGAGAAWSVIQAWQKGRGARLGWLIVAVSFVVVACLPLAYWSWVYHERDKQMPMLSDFDDDWERHLWEVNRARLSFVRPPAEWASARGRVAKLELQAAEYPGLNSEEFYEDWSGHDTLTMDLYNPGTPFDLTLRIDDRAHRGNMNDRFNHVWEVPTGPSSLRILLQDLRDAPANRTMDLTDMDDLVFFAYQLDRPATIFIDNLRLESAEPARSGQVRLRWPGGTVRHRSDGTSASR